MNNIKLVVDKLSYSNILKDISFSLSEGDVIALIGPNGAGKTTLLKNVMGLTKSESGTMNFKNIGNIAAVFQDNLLDGELSVQQNYRYRINKKTNYIFALNKLKEFNINPKTLYSNLSGGQKRIVNYLRAIAIHPNFLLLDELTAGIDVDIRKTIWRDLNSYLDEERCGAIFTTHLLNELDNANKILFLENGKVKYFGNMTNFMSRMPKVKLLLESFDETKYFDSSKQAVEFIQKHGLENMNFEIMKTSYTDLFRNVEAEVKNVH